MAKHFILAVLILFSFDLLSQQYSLKGIVQDGDKSELIGAVVVVLNAKDSTLVGYTLTDNDGKFTITSLPKATYNLQITYIGFGTLQRLIELNGDTRVMDLGTIIMAAEGKMLDQVTISADYIPIRVTKDTIEFNADAFKTQPNAVVEDLLRKLPGVEVDSEGGIKVQGEDVKAVTVDGKSFFGKDPKMATKNLPANAIKKVQIFDKKSKSAEFTGVDDGQDEKTINLELKEDKKGGYFGNAMAGYGTDDRYEGKAMINRFSKKSQKSFIGSLNNLNNTGINVSDFASMQGGSGGGRNMNFNTGAPISFGQNNMGEISSATIGLNLNYDFGKKNQLNFSYYLSQSDTELRQSSTTDNFVQNRSLISEKKLKSTSETIGHNFYSSVDIKIDSSSEMTLTGSLALRNNNSNSDQLDTTQNEMKKILNISDQIQNNNTENDNFSAQINYRKKFFKPGRSITVDGSYGKSGNQALNELLSEVYDETLVLNMARSVFQLQNSDLGSDNYSLGASYTEPLSKKWFLVLNASRRNNRSDQLKEFFYLDPETKTIGDLNTELSRTFDNTFLYTIGGTNFRFRNDNFSSNLGVDYQISELNGIPSIGKVVDIKFNYFLPKASIDFEKTNIRINYSTSVREPSVDQLQPIVDNSDPLNLYVGNPNLIPEYIHNMRMSYHFFDQFNFRSLFASVRLGYTKNKITTASVVDEFFIRSRTPLNTDQETTSSANLNYSSPLNFMRAKYRVGVNSSFTRGINIINNLPNDIDRWSNGLNLTLENKSKTFYDGSISSRFSFTDNIYKNNENLNTSFVNQTYEGNLAVFAGKGWTIDTKYEYLIYGQGSFDGSTKVNLWQASISKGFMDNKLTVKARVFDMLNQNVGVNRTASETYVSETISNTIGRYVMLNVTYSLSALGGGAKPPQRMMIMHH